MSSRRPVPQTSFGRLVSLTVDNPHYYTSSPVAESSMPTSGPLPHLVPIASASTTNQENDNDAEEKTMLWKNVATLFAKYDNLESTVQQHHESLKRRSDDIYGDLKGMWCEFETLQTDVAENNVLSKHVRKIRKYVNKKCEKLKEDVNYGSSCADDEIFAYIDTLRGEFDTRIKNLQDENTRREQEISELNDTYYRDYEMFVQRENDLMAKLDTAVKMNEALNARLKDFEDRVMRQLDIKHNQIYTVREELIEQMNQLDFHLAGDLREEFAHAITKEVAFESKTSAQLVQSVNDELTEMITRSNEYHSYRYFGLVEEVKQIRENSETLKKSIGMVDAELSDVKENIEHLTDEVGQNTTDVCDLQEDLADLNDDIYREMDRDYYDLKDYVKRQNHRHEKKYHPREEDHHDNDVPTIVAEDADPQPQPQPQNQQQNQPQPENEEHVIIIDENMFRSDDEDEEVLAPQV
jgi:chromosome segregation ATPase